MNNIKYIVILSIMVMSQYACQKNEMEIDRVNFSVSATSFAVGDTIRGSFVNNNDVDVYRYRPTPAYTWLEKREAGNWVPVIIGNIVIQVLVFDLIRSGERVLIEYPYEALSEMVLDSVPGTYRFAVSIVRSEGDSESWEFWSDSFDIN